MSAGLGAPLAVTHRCPRCHAVLTWPASAQGAITCEACHAAFPLIDGIPSFELSGHDRVRAFFSEVASRSLGSNIAYIPEPESPAFKRQAHVYAAAVARVLGRWVPYGTLVLDVGCGHGMLREFATSHYRMAGIDFVFRMLPSARAQGYAVYHGEATALPFADNQFGAALCTEILNQYEDPAAEVLLGELSRICVPNGLVILSTMNRASALRLLVRFARRLSGQAPMDVPQVSRTCRSVVAIAERHGLLLSEAAWLLSPTRALTFSQSCSTVVAPLATNYFVCLRKRSDAS